MNAITFEIVKWFGYNFFIFITYILIELYILKNVFTLLLFLLEILANFPDKE